MKISQGIKQFGGCGATTEEVAELVLPSKRGSMPVIRKIGGPRGSGYGCELVAAGWLKELGRP
ncbi:hypothetical protein, partial [Streptomyces sp. NPDC096311]|uniref:hypothetical protein n=1 Tax=Streptomyces sp. NPDC096311 TaxID=3366083 RepID=UPI00380917F2